MSPRAIREQLHVSKDQGSKVKSILRKLVLKKLILQKGNLFAHSDLRTGHDHKKKKSFENPRLRRSKMHQLKKPTSLRADSSLQVKGLVLSILARARVMFSYRRGTRTGLWMVT